MDVTTALSSSSRSTAAVILLTVLAVEWGGLTVLRLMRGRRPAIDFQRGFARAGHAHAGVFVILALVSQILVDATELEGVREYLARYRRGSGLAERVVNRGSPSPRHGAAWAPARPALR